MYIGASPRRKMAQPKSKTIGGMVWGIDPGLHGAMVGLKRPKQIVYAENLPVIRIKRAGKYKNVFDFRAFSNIIEFQVKKQWPMDLVEFYVEEPLAIPRMSKQSIASIWACYGSIVGCLASAGMHNINAVEPRDWQILYQLVPRSLKLEGKDRSFWLAKKLFGKEAENDGIADAMCIAWWGANQKT
jgi:hypothetical protein